MKLPKFIRPKKKLRASTARRSLVSADEMDYEEMSEPNMKLSRALLIVLVLHVVAVAGIIAFNTIKSRQGAFPSQPVASASTAAARVEATPANPEPVASASSTPMTVQKALPAGAAEPSAIPKALPATTDSSKFYVVAKGDNPVSIARHLKVSESDLLSVNHIEDPRKLQIGQKLIIPAKAAKGKKSND